MKSLMTNEKGSITVFLTFVLFFVFTLAGSLLETARFYSGKAYSNGVLIGAADSVLTEYYAPLQKEYHLFFANFGNGNEDETEVIIKNKMLGYSQYSLKPGMELDIWNWQFEKLEDNLINTSIEEIEISNIQRTIDKNGRIFREQAAAYMKYKGIEHLLENFLKKEQVINSSKEAAKIIDKKFQTEERAALLNKYMLQVIQSVEGLAVNNDGLLYNSNHTIKMKKCFAKRLCTSTPDAGVVGISNTLVWTSSKNHYVNVDKLMQTLIKDIESAGELLQIIGLSEEKEEAAGLEAKLKLENQIIKINTEKKEIVALFESVKQSIAQALLNISKLESERKVVEKELSDYKEVLEKNQSKLDNITYAGLLEDYQAMEDYVGDKEKCETAIKRITDMKPILEQNLLILDKCMELKGMTCTKSNMTQMERTVTMCLCSFYNYNIMSLKFDYSDLIAKEQVNNPMDSVGNLLKSSILDLVLPEGISLSGKKLLSTDYLLERYKQDKNETPQNLTIEKDMSQINKTRSIGGAAKTFSCYGDNKMEEDKSKDSYLTDFLMIMYMEDHFTSFTTEEKQIIENCLQYEREYILFGNERDIDNLSTMTTQIVLSRTICNFISLMGDKEKGALAYSTAIALVGFTGLEPLVRFTKTMILLVWAFEEGLVDAAAILSGYSVPIIKNSSEFLIRYEELCVINRSAILKKAASYKEKINKNVTINYIEYIRLNLLFQKESVQNFRNLQLIDQNIQLKYNKDFRIERGISGFHVKGIFLIKHKFLAIPETDLFHKKKESIWQIELEYEACY
ncbi:DUF5702 domain-containing protein [Anaeromicropila populeti]|uniref:Uncharacterized protein n=1 Tax=Anaeromicropila populeti TaxID=37658 RepID=A0A1I6LS18_9FIRM|nr:DUF5702 domain-containing protein [Anaeromicropila populeti]SFS06261.1 hypothetical protein SAMN05661086_03525 [Anaeromicropila populeti]